MSAYRARTGELSPSAATTRSYDAASSPTSGASVRKCIVDVELAAALLEDLEQPAPAHRGEAVAAAGGDRALEVDVDVVPDRELALHRGVHLRVGVLDPAQRLVAEHHPEAERVVRGVALPHRDLVLLPGQGGQLLRQRAEVEPAGPAADHCDPHPSTIAFS